MGGTAVAVVVAVVVVMWGGSKLSFFWLPSATREKEQGAARGERGGEDSRIGSDVLTGMSRQTQTVHRQGGHLCRAPQKKKGQVGG